ncbi:MAG: 50S ribosomal protein L33, partial [Trueperaceae bacterium]|nr:50S ribosomal protein L33 [Trueperaceae bacterium]
RIKVVLRSSAGTGYGYVTTKNRQTTPSRLSLRKYDPILRRHVRFHEEKLR